MVTIKMTVIMIIIQFAIFFTRKNRNLPVGCKDSTSTRVTEDRVISKYRGADKSLAQPGRKQATATEDFDFHISYL